MPGPRIGFGAVGPVYSPPCVSPRVGSFSPPWNLSLCNSSPSHSVKAAHGRI